MGGHKPETNIKINKKLNFLVFAFFPETRYIQTKIKKCPGEPGQQVYHLRDFENGNCIRETKTKQTDDANARSKSKIAPTCEPINGDLNKFLFERVVQFYRGSSNYILNIVLRKEKCK